MDGRMDATGTPILVTGGTGTLGKLVVTRLLDAGPRVRVASRGQRSHDEAAGVEFVAADLSTGDGVDAAVQGIDVVIHCAGSSKGDELKARHLVEAAARAGVRHIVFISVVGADRVPVEGRMDRAMFGYFASKLAAERVVAESGLPWTTLRATQFHDLLFMTAQAMSRLPIVPAPSGMRFQPVDAAEVADRLVQLALGAPAGLVPDIAGPQARDMTDLLRAYLRAAGKHRLVVRVPMAGRAARAIREGANLSPDRAVGRLGWDEFLRQRLAATEDRTAELA